MTGRDKFLNTLLCLAVYCDEGAFAADRAQMKTGRFRTGVRFQLQEERSALRRGNFIP